MCLFLRRANLSVTHPPRIVLQTNLNNITASSIATPLLSDSYHGFPPPACHPPITRIPWQRMRENSVLPGHQQNGQQAAGYST